MKIDEYKIHPPVSIKRWEGYRFYRENYTGAKTNKLTRFVEWKDVVNACWKEVADSVVNSKGGVYLRGIGYMAVWMNPVKQMEHRYTPDKKYVTCYNDHTDHHTYHLSLFTNIDKSMNLRYFTMDRGFHQHVTRRISKELKKGVRYVLRHTLLKKIFNNRTEHAY